MEQVKGRFRPALFVAILLVHLIAAYSVWWCWTWGAGLSAWLLMVGLYTVSSLGITAGYHRYFTHGQFRCHKGVKYALAVAGGLAGEGTLWDWCRTHKQHHRFTDDAYDPHTPWRYEHLPRPFNTVVGFLWAHVGWLFWATERPAWYNPKFPVQDTSIIEWQRRYYWHIVIAGFVIPFMIAGWGGLFLAGFIRIVAHWHVTWMVNSVCHLWGTRPLGPDGEVWKKDKSRNNLLVALLGMGEGWHGYHHVQQNSAELGFRWYHWDPGKWLIRMLQLMRLTWDIRPFKRA